MPTTVLSNESPLCLPNGVMAPQLRRGNRYRLMWSALGPTNEPRLSISPTFQLDLSAFMLSPQSDYNSTNSSNNSQLMAMIQELFSNMSTSNTTINSAQNDASIQFKEVDAIEDNSFEQSTRPNPSPMSSTYHHRSCDNTLPNISSSKAQLLSSIISNDDNNSTSDDQSLTQLVPTNYQQLTLALQQQETINDSFAQIWPDMLNMLTTTTTTIQQIDKENQPLQNESIVDGSVQSAPLMSQWNSQYTGESSSSIACWMHNNSSVMSTLCSNRYDMDSPFFTNDKTE